MDLGVVRGERKLNGTFDFKRVGTKDAKDEDLPTATVMDLSVGPDGVLYAATHSRGIWGAKLGQVDVPRFKPERRTFLVTPPPPAPASPTITAVRSGRK